MCAYFVCGQDTLSELVDTYRLLVNNRLLSRPPLCSLAALEPTDTLKSIVCIIRCDSLFCRTYVMYAIVYMLVDFVLASMWSRNHVAPGLAKMLFL